jgi:hypothetical protein
MLANLQTADEGESVPLSGNMSLVKVVLHSLLLFLVATSIAHLSCGDCASKT